MIYRQVFVSGVHFHAVFVFSSFGLYLGFDKLKEDENETTLETIRIELTNKKLQNTLICFHAVFDGKTVSFLV